MEEEGLMTFTQANHQVACGTDVTSSVVVAKSRVYCFSITRCQLVQDYGSEAQVVFTFLYG